MAHRELTAHEKSILDAILGGERITYRGTIVPQIKMTKQRAHEDVPCVRIKFDFSSGGSSVVPLKDLEIYKSKE